jgi:chromate transporter
VLAFGGQGGLLALLSRDLVERRGWVGETDIAEAFTYVQLLPGAVVVQVVAYLGYKLRGWRGAATATICFLLPSVVAMLALAAAYRRVASIAGVPAALNGLTAAVVGLIALAAYKQARKTIRHVLGALIAVAVCAISIRWHVNPAILVIAAGMIGIVREAASRPGLRTDSARDGSGANAP